MKKLFLVVFLLSIFIVSSYAQGRYSVKDRVANLKSKLSLNDRQTAQVDSILTAASNKVKNLSSDKGERRSEMREIMTDANKQIMTILTARQKTEYQKMQNDRKERMRNRRNLNNQ